MENNFTVIPLNKITRQDTCLICGSLTRSILNKVYDTRFGIENEFEISICTSCGMKQTNPSPTFDELSEFYSSCYNFGGETNTTYTRFREMFLRSWVYHVWIILDGDISFHGVKGKGKLLDVGCNEGRGLKLYAKNGFSAEGLELNPIAAQAALKNGFVVHQKPIDQLSGDNQFNVVILSNVIEHSLNPQSMLNHIYRVLKPHGQVWISCPNNKSWLKSLFGRYWINWHVPFHIFHFSENNLDNLLKRAGFANVKHRQETPSLWVAHSLIAYLFSKPEIPTKQLRSPFIIVVLILFIRFFLFPFLWLGNHLGFGDCLVTTASKE